MRKRIFLIILCLMTAILFLGLTQYHSTQKSSHLKILVTIKPLYSLVCGLTKNIPGIETQLLLHPPHSPHTFHLKPSDVQKISEADLIIWVGPDLENFLISALQNVSMKEKNLPLLKTAKLDLLNLRQDQDFEAHDHSHDHGLGHDHSHDHSHDHDHNHHHDHHVIDPHIWLNTHNAKQIILAISQRLQAMDPIHKKNYHNNQLRLIKKLDQLHTAIKQDLKNKPKPFLVFHDAFQYFEKEFSLKAAGSITLNPEAPLSAKRLQEVQQKIEKENVFCVFSEPEFNKNIVQRISNQNKIKNSEIDPLGSRINAPKNEEEIYFNLMREISHTFRSCS